MSIADEIRRAALLIEQNLCHSITEKNWELAARLTAAIPAIEVMEKDAARYGWLRPRNKGFTSEALDAFIDAALEKVNG